MFENNYNWAISNQAPVKWRRLNDHPLWSRRNPKWYAPFLWKGEDMVYSIWRHIVGKTKGRCKLSQNRVTCWKNLSNCGNDMLRVIYQARAVMIWWQRVTPEIW